MNKLSKEQLNLLEIALKKLYSFIKLKYNFYYTGNIVCGVYDNFVLYTQCSCPPNIAWSADIFLKKRKICFCVRYVEHDTINSTFNYDLIYMDSEPTIHTLHF